MVRCYFLRQLLVHAHIHCGITLHICRSCYTIDRDPTQDSFTPLETALRDQTCQKHSITQYLTRNLATVPGPKFTRKFSQLSGNFGPKFSPD